MKENPYRLAEDINGVGFKMADELAARIGVRADSEYRIRSGILYTLMQAVGEGNCYLPIEKLIGKAAELLGVPGENIRLQTENLMMDKKVVIKEDQVFLSAYYYAELNCARMLHDLNVPLVSEEAMPDTGTLKRLVEIGDMELDELQFRAVSESVRNGVTILAGGPGTGKTTTINMMIKYFEAEGMDIFLAAPTGRAAKRMTEATGFEAKTYAGAEQRAAGRKFTESLFRKESRESAGSGCDHYR